MIQKIIIWQNVVLNLSVLIQVLGVIHAYNDKRGSIYRALIVHLQWFLKNRKLLKDKIDMFRYTCTRMQMVIKILQIKSQIRCIAFPHNICKR